MNETEYTTSSSVITILVVSLYKSFRLTQIIAEFYNHHEIKAIFMLALMWLVQVDLLKIDEKRARQSILSMRRELADICEYCEHDSVFYVV